MNDYIDDDNNDLLTELLNTDYSQVDTSAPLIANGSRVLVKIVGVEIKTGKTSGKQYIEFALKTLEPAPSTKGAEIPPGYYIRHIISLVKTDKYNPQQKIAQMMDCFFGKRIPLRDFQVFLNTEGFVKVKIEEQESSTFGLRNVVDRCLPLSQKTNPF